MFITRHKKIIRILCWILFWAYIVAMVYFLFFAEMLGRNGTAQSYHYNLILFREIRRFWVYREQVGMLAAIMNLAGNIFIFVPFGFLVPAISRKWKGVGRVVFLGFEVSLIVECVQLVTKTGCFDVDDLLLNTLGSLLGYFIYACVQKTRDVRVAHWRKMQEKA